MCYSRDCQVFIIDKYARARDTPLKAINHSWVFLYTFEKHEECKEVYKQAYI